MTRPTISSDPVLAHKILVVDDMEANRAVLVRRLERYGYDVASVDSGAAALAYIAAQAPDLVLLDYMMPQMNGVEVLQELRMHADTRDLPVIMVTARAEGEATIEALNAGADDYVTKPVDFDVLRARIETHLSKKESSTDLKRANAVLDERVLQRAIALADLEVELKHEIEKRRELEGRVDGQNVRAASPAAEVLNELPASKALFLASVEAIQLKYEMVFSGATSGRALNVAIMAEIKLMLEQLKSHLR